MWKDRSGRKTPPVFSARLTFPTEIGYLQARRANALFNQENSLDFLLWIACFPKFLADVINKDDGSFDEELYGAIEKAFKEGSNLIPGSGGKYVAPPMDPAKITA